MALSLSAVSAASSPIGSSWTRSGVQPGSSPARSTGLNALAALSVPPGFSRLRSSRLPALNGTSRSETLTGTRRSEAIAGLAGNDVLISNGGLDRLTGGRGRDRFVLSGRSTTAPAAATLTITDFQPGQDQIQISGIPGLSFDRLRFRSVNQDLLIQDKTTGRAWARLRNSASRPLRPTDFRGLSAVPMPTPSPILTGGSGAIEFSASALRFQEGRTNVEIIVTRSSSVGSVSASYSTSNNTAIAGQDYLGISGQITFNPGETRKTIALPLFADSQFEPAEVLKLQLSDARNGGTIGNRSTLRVTIVNDDRPSEAEIWAIADAQTTSGSTTVYTGYHGVETGSNGNKDPWLASFTNGQLNWYRDDYEITPDDSTGTHVLWNGNELYAAFTSTGTQGSSSEDFRRFATNGWLKTYSDFSPGGGGGGRVAVLARINPLTGEPTQASFLTALNGNRTNSLFVRQLEWSGSSLRVLADSAFAPRRPDRSAMTRNDRPTTSPNYTIEFAPDLSSVVRATAVDYS